MQVTAQGQTYTRHPRQEARSQFVELWHAPDQAGEAFRQCAILHDHVCEEGKAVQLRIFLYFVHTAR